MDSIPAAVTEKYADHSTVDAFSFSFYCDMCGKEYHSVRYALNAGGLPAPIDPAVYQMVWNDQHKAAFDRANLDASFVFSRCPLCGRRVCDACFYVSETGISDVCEDCRKKESKERAEA